MQRSENINGLATALEEEPGKDIVDILQEIQGMLVAPKGQYNEFGKYKYRSCEDVLEALKPFLTVSRCAVVITDEVVLIGERYYVRATATLWRGKESISVKAFAREPKERKGMDESQITGATSSYARKYALNGLFAIDDNKDPDTTNEHGTRKAEDFPTKVNDPKNIQFQVPTLLDNILAMAKEKFASPEEFKMWRIDNDLTEDLKAIKDQSMEMAKVSLALQRYKGAK